MPKNKNYYLHRDSGSTEVPWLRPSEPAKLPLATPVVLVNGAFDMLHSNHMRVLFAAARNAGTVICALDSDRKVRRAKGPQRPIMSFAERAAALNYMPINYIVEIDSEAQMATLVRSLEPLGLLRVQGDEYRDQPSRFAARKALVRGGALHTSTLVDRILARYAR